MGTVTASRPERSGRSAMDAMTGETGAPWLSLVLLFTGPACQRNLRCRNGNWRRSSGN